MHEALNSPIEPDVNSGPPRMRRLLSQGLGYTAVGAILTGFFLILQQQRPFPFATTNDNVLYFLGFVKEFTDRFFESGRPMRMLWSLGAGWNPWDSGQAGYLYPPYYLANLLARAVGRPMAIMEASAAIHVVGAGLIAYWLLPRRITGWSRITWALFAGIAPGGLLVGLNWHHYLAPTPWFIGICLLLQRNIDTDTPWPRWERLALMGLSIGMFLGGHPQMYSIGMTLAGLWIIAEAGGPRRIAYHLSILVMAQLPMVVPVLFLKLLSLQATSEMMRGRYSWDWMLTGATPWNRVAFGTLFGNLFTGGWTGLITRDGMFFSPAMAIVLVAAIWRRHWRLVLLIALMFLIMAVGTFPWVRYLGFGPFASFRWTWKLSLLAGPLMIASLLHLLHLRKTPWPAWYGAMAGVFAVVAGVVVTRGMDSASLDAAHAIGAPALMNHTKDALAELGIPKGSRIAIVGRYYHKYLQTYPLPLIGIAGNNPAAIGYTSAHVYEPLEPAKTAKGHHGLSVIWRGSVSSKNYKLKREETEARLRKIGVQYLITAEADVFDPAVAKQFVDRNGKSVWAVPLPDAIPLQYPWAIYKKRGTVEPLKQRPDGTLISTKKRKHPPKLPTPHKVTWERYKNGRWKGTPVGIEPKWVWGTLGLSAVAIAGLMLLPRPRGDDEPAPFESPLETAAA